MKLTKKTVLKYFSYLFKFIIVLALVHFSVVFIYGHVDNTSKSDVIVVLGNKVNKDGNPSDRLAARLDRAYKEYENGKGAKVIVSGGLGIEGYEESDVMATYLINRGIPKEDIINDTNGVNTAATGKFVVGYMEQEELESVMVVTSYYHILRTKMYLNKLGIEQVRNAHSIYYEPRDVYSIFREIVATYFYLLHR